MTKEIVEKNKTVGTRKYPAPKRKRRILYAESPINPALLIEARTKNIPRTIETIARIECLVSSLKLGHHLSLLPPLLFLDDLLLDCFADITFIITTRGVNIKSRYTFLQINIMSDTIILMEEHYGHLKDNTQKLTAALYRVTDLMSDREPIKWTLRDKSLTIYSNIMSIRKNSDNSIFLEEILSLLDGIISMLNLFSLGIYASKMNFEILSKEYNKLKDIIGGDKNTSFLSEGASFFEEIKRPIGQKPMENVLLNKNNKVDKVENRLEPEKAIVYEDRKSKIIALLKDNKAKTTTEIREHFHNVGEKTIQRDLSSLVLRGIIKAEGEKRWRRYSLQREIVR
ncbi:MAG TPA: hypothetical protein VJJ73_00110 [Candidatus Paceibacterota bacterium]